MIFDQLVVTVSWILVDGKLVPSDTIDSESSVRKDGITLHVMCRITGGRWRDQTKESQIESIPLRMICYVKCIKHIDKSLISSIDRISKTCLS